MTPDPKRARLVQVQSLHDISPRLRRVVFHSPELADYPFTCAAAHLKILLPPPISKSCCRSPAKNCLCCPK